MHSCLKILLVSMMSFQLHAENQVTADDVVGLYATSSEIAGFTGTTMYISLDHNKELNYEMTFYSDVVLVDHIKQDVIRGEAILKNGLLILAKPWGYYYEGKPELRASIDVYYPIQHAGHFMLMREDAYKTWTTTHKVYDYGILVQVRKKLEHEFFPKVTIPPIKMTDIFGIEGWTDPFVNGPNKTSP